ncbi:MAG: 16S rRNA (cytidine(1402)-2'-O)-methyltransferase [Alphaproteobacteria bacterium]|nr:16S rRNA (cytidine(1402)-2'-O)-methyltransferase [Alphaproteobacteria bacterium]
MQAGLYIVGTPIGNLGDMSPRGIDTLKNADLIACEDTRVSGILAAKFDIKTKRIPLHEHNERETADNLIKEIQAGKSIAVISDSGMPGISDPGFNIVRAARAAGISIFAVPGPTAFATALSISGFPTDRFSFLGFMPSTEGGRNKELTQASRHPGTLIYYESPNRIRDTLAALARIMPERRIAVARELTKIFDEVITGYPADFPKFEERGEIVLLIEPAARPTLSDGDIREIVEDVVKSARSTKEAAIEIASRGGIPKSEAYAKALEAKK